VVQQRAGVHLAGGVGRDGDAYEQHADRVADAVVAGEPAEYLLGQMAGPSGGARGAVQMKKELPKGDEAFDKMWAAHPHNDGYGGEEDTDSEEVRSEHGLPDYIDNTCAVRLSIMMNGIGETITPAKTKAAGIDRKPHYSSKTKQYYILAAREMWTYLSKYYRAPDVVFPPDGTRFADREAFMTSFDATVKPLLSGKKGIVAFDKIFGFGGTGHVDLFNGEALSDSGDWYPSQRLLLWYVSVPT
jgi:Type VI secretion system (T6SS), amidase effector protein 4